jgi:hypothetical protein
MMTLEAEQRTDERAPWRGSAGSTVTLEQFQLFVQWIVQQPSTSADVARALQAASWMAEVDVFRQHEDALPDHRVLLSDLIARGEAIVCTVNKSGMATPPVNFTLQDLQATLESLHVTFRCEYGPKNSQKTNQLISQLFDGPQSRD